MSGEGNYRLGDVKQVAITDDFAAMDEKDRNCQTESSFEDCATQNILLALAENCKCLPYNLRNYSSHEDQVEFMRNLLYQKINKYISIIFSRFHYVMTLVYHVLVI